MQYKVTLTYSDEHTEVVYWATEHAARMYATVCENQFDCKATVEEV